MRLGRTPSKIAAWVRQGLPGSRWLGKSYAYRTDGEGYVWLNLDAIDGHRVQRPGRRLRRPPTLYEGRAPSARLRPPQS